MKILVDEGMMSKGAKSGIGYHALNLGVSLCNLAECELTDHKIAAAFPRYFRKWAYIVSSNLTARNSCHDLVHYLNHYVPFAVGRSIKVMTVYDLSVLRYPETVSLAWRHYNQHAFRRGLERADGLIAISKSIGQEIIDSFPIVSSDKVYVAPIGLRQSFLNAQCNEEVVAQHSLRPFGYFLFVGDLTKRKNIKFMLEVFLRAIEERKIDDSTQLVLIGKRAWGYAEFESLLKNRKNIRVAGYIRDNDLPSFYRFSKALVFPSVYEGFGVPPIEAMSQGVPIIASNIATNEELNDAHNRQMLIFKLDDEEGLLRLFQRVDAEWDEIRRHLNYGDLSKYTYERIAKEHLTIYEQISDLARRQS